MRGLAAIQCPVDAVGGGTDGYRIAIPRRSGFKSTSRRPDRALGACPIRAFQVQAPEMGWRQEILRWWDELVEGR